jgi:hypothetical protein
MLGDIPERGWKSGRENGGYQDQGIFFAGIEVGSFFF